MQATGDEPAEVARRAGVRVDMKRLGGSYCRAKATISSALSDAVPVVKR